MSRFRLFEGDCRDVLARLPENRFHACVTDPPYHLTSKRGGRRGMMGHVWDGGDVAFDPDTWRAVLRALRPGAWLACFGGTRTVHRVACAVEDAGFEIRDDIASYIGGARVEWIQGQGMPKSKRGERMVAMALCELPGRHHEATLPDVGKRLPGDHVCPNVAVGDVWVGWGTGLRPHHEPVILARKPLDGTIGENLLRWGTGCIWIDGTRNEHSDEADLEAHRATVAAIKAKGGVRGESWKNDSDLSGASDVNEAGRWTPNVALCHDASCWLRGCKELDANPTWDTPNRDTVPSQFAGKAVSSRRAGRRAPGGASREGEASAERRYEGKGGTSFAAKPGRRAPEVEVVEDWVCVESCPIAQLERQKPGGSRYFSRFAWSREDALSFVYVPKARRSSASLGDYAFPTPKPISLIRHLVRLVAGPGGRDVLDPFVGSGTTAIAAIREGHRCAGIELMDTDEHPHARLARHRVYLETGERSP